MRDCLYVWSVKLGWLTIGWRKGDYIFGWAYTDIGIVYEYGKFEVMVDVP